MSLLLTHAAQLITLAGPARARKGPEMLELGCNPDGAVYIEGDRIVGAGPTDQVRRLIPAGAAPEEVDCRGRLVTPGLVDSHTHLVFAAPRLDDFERRLAGASYEAMAAAGGGIRSSVEKLRAAPLPQLETHATRWLLEARAWGATTVEAKTGYGLEIEAERKSLRAAAAAARATGMDVPRTFLGAHIVPAEWARDRAGYITHIVQAMLDDFTAPANAAYAPEFVDVFCDPAGFNLDETRTILQAAAARQMPVRLHAEQFANIGGIQLGIRMGAVAVDHLDQASADDIRQLAAASTVATLLPGSNLFLGRAWPPARELVDRGAAVALASDFNPGTCPSIPLPLAMALACSGMRLTPAEAWTAATINGAAALGRAHVCGSLQPGMRADLAVFAGGDYRAVPYHFGVNLCEGVVQAGVWLPTPPPAIQTQQESETA